MIMFFCVTPNFVNVKIIHPVKDKIQSKTIFQDVIKDFGLRNLPIEIEKFNLYCHSINSFQTNSGNVISIGGAAASTLLYHPF